MTPTEHETLNTTTDSFDVQYRYFSGQNWVGLIKAGLSQLSGWTAPDTGKPETWTEITDKVAYSSRFTQTLTGSSIAWVADLSGWDYNNLLMGQGIAVVCWRRIYRPTGTVTAPAGWQPWLIEFIGEFTDTEQQADYKAGKTWSRQVTGYNNWLGRYNAPRITAGKIDIVDSTATLTGASELSQPELEKDKGEFVGGTADVSLDNVKDGNKNTVYISQEIPEGVDTPWPPDRWDGNCYIMEFCIKPIPGWPVERSWWAEVYWARGQNPGPPEILGAYRDDQGQTHYWNGGGGPSLSQGESGLFVAHRQTFDELWGGDNVGGKWVFDVSNRCDCKLTLDGALLIGGDCYAWSPGGQWRDYVFNRSWVNIEFHGYTLDSNTIPAGSSWWMKVDGQPLNGYHDWFPHWPLVINSFPHPGANRNGSWPIWIKVQLADNVCTTLDEISASSQTIRLDNYKSWLAPDWRGGEHSYGIVGGYVFDWTSRDSNGLHGVTWHAPVPSAPIPAGTRCYPYVNNESMTGYPLVSTSLVRRKLPAISHYKVYWSRYLCRDWGVYEEEPVRSNGWEADYDAHFHEQNGNTQNLKLTDSCATATKPYRWVRTFQYLIYHMTDNGRVKVNEIDAELYQGATDLQGSPTYDGSDATVLAEYLWLNWCQLPVADFYPSITRACHKMGQHALAITPVTKVYDDLAAATGCLVWFKPTGGVAFIDDPWWPLNSGYSAPYTFQMSDVRGEVTYEEHPVYIDYMILNALSIDGDPHSLRYIYPSPPPGQSEPPVWAMVSESNNKVISKDSHASSIAQMELRKLTEGARSCSFIIKGVGEWCSPGIKVWTYFDNDGDGYEELRCWIIEAVTNDRSKTADGQMSYTTTVSLRGLWG